MRCILFLSLIFAQAAQAKDFYCDPVNGFSPRNVGKGISAGTSNDGSLAKPWGSVATLFTNKLVNGTLVRLSEGLDVVPGIVHAGDRIILLDGDHGVVLMANDENFNAKPITMVSEVGHKPIVTRLVTGKAIRNWLFQEMIFQNLPNVIKYQKIVQVSGEGVTFHKCHYRSAEDPTKWTDEELRTNCPQYGLYISGRNFRVTECQFYGLENGAHFDCDGLLVEGNTVEYCLSDGFTHSSSNALITKNRIVNQKNLATNPYHHDGMQGWAKPGTINVNVTISDNYIAYSDGKYPDIPPISPTKGTDVFQGIVNFSGPWDKLVIKGNIVMGVGYHGITAYDAINSEISNNTVIDQGTNGIWVLFNFSKAPSTNLISNNIARYYQCQEGTRMENNFAFVRAWQSWAQSPIVVNPKDIFELYQPEQAKFDLRVREGSIAAERTEEVKTIVMVPQEVITKVRIPAAGAVQSDVSKLQLAP